VENQIAPALSADEWKEKHAARPGHDGEIAVCVTDDGLGVGYHADKLGQDWMYPTRAGAAAFIALANAALPDDSPYKITRADLAMLETCETYEPDYGGLARLQRKIAALLPP
jgi:hypothetical protein